MRKIHEKNGNEIHSDAYCVIVKFPLSLTFFSIIVLIEVRIFICERDPTHFDDCLVIDIVLFASHNWKLST